jgi:hypothetical protein
MHKALHTNPSLPEMIQQHDLTAAIEAGFRSRICSLVLQF